MNKRRFPLKKFFRARQPRKIGEQSLAQKAVNFLTLAPLRRNAGRWFTRFFGFAKPGWTSTLGRLKYSPEKQLTRWDYVNPVYWVAWLLGFSYRWLVSRPYLQLGPALLAILAAAWLGGLMVRQSWERLDWRGQQYQAMLSQAIALGDEELADLCLVNLITRYPERSEFRLQQALLQAKQGDTADAMSTMLDLALNRKDGHAALWLANESLDMQELVNWNNDQHQQFRNLMEIALTDRRSQTEPIARGLYSQYLIGIGAYAEAIRNLATIAPRNPTTHLTIAGLYAKLGDQDNATKHAELARQHFEAELLKMPSNKEARMLLAQVFLILQQEQKAATTLSDGYRLTNGNDKDFTIAGAEALVAWAMRLRQSDDGKNETLVQQINLLTQASKLAPNSATVLEALVEVAIQCADSGDQRVLQLREALLNGVAPDNLHFIEGTIALFNGDTEAANVHLDLAAQNGQQMPGVLNNLAVALSQKASPDLERALALSNAAIEQTKDLANIGIAAAYLRETRGQILVKMERFQQAIPDLEAALGAEELRPAVHRSLATSYRALGRTELAKQHEQMLAALSGEK